MAKKKRFNQSSIKKVGEIMENMDTPHGDFNLTGAFQQNGAGGPPAQKISHPLVTSFRNTYENVDSEHLAHEIFTLGRLREYFQAWIVPRMPDPLPSYIDELDYIGFPIRTSFDGSPCIMVRYRGAVDIKAEEVTMEDCTPLEVSPVSVSDGEVMVYTDDWEDDMSDIPNPFEDRE